MLLADPSKNLFQQTARIFASPPAEPWAASLVAKAEKALMFSSLSTLGQHCRI
jgi:hypothetical protein